ncbi:small ubiquitin-related modifier-like [Myzus persicae]|uniref:small ubiquitin-related modifier-like n=1 Tax=Myzus persicae TaxID=13164 RepID=UPI000B93760A|nr:small ubiquitin-related modifier-like [Myzus persicae]XP_022182231.1 small ubiquitin-related modifier-like [Myzus persicae]
MSTVKEESYNLPSTSGTSVAVAADQRGAAGNESVVTYCAEYISIRVTTSARTNEVHFRLKPDVTFVCMKTTYCKKLGFINKDDSRFVYDCIRIADDYTPKSLHMMDGDVVEIYQVLRN